MSKKNVAHIEEKEFIVKEFVWVDGTFRCSSGTILAILHNLANAESVVLLDEEFINYLMSKQLIVLEKNNCYTVAPGKVDACITLGNNISRCVEKQLASVNPDEVDYITKK